MSEHAPVAANRFRVALLGLLMLLLVASVAFLVFTLTSRVVDTAGIHTGSDLEQGDRSTVQSQAEQFMLRINNFGPDLYDKQTKQMPKYRHDVEGLLTAKFKTSFDQNVGTAEQLVASGASRTGLVYATGVSDIDQDSATVLVAGSFTVSYTGPDGKAVKADPDGFRWVISMIKTKGAWLVDNAMPEPDPNGAPQPTVPSISIPPQQPSLPSDATTTLPPPTTKPTTKPTTRATTRATTSPTRQPSSTTLPPVPTPTRTPRSSPHAPTAPLTSGAAG